MAQAMGTAGQDLKEFMDNPGIETLTMDFLTEIQREYTELTTNLFTQISYLTH